MGKFQLFPVQASTLAPEVDHLLYFLLAVTVFFTLLIFGAIFYFAIRYRRRSENELPHVVHTGYTLEILWSVIPFGITMVMFTWGAAIFFNASKPPNDEHHHRDAEGDDAPEDLQGITSVDNMG